MSRPLPATFLPLPLDEFGPSAPIKQGDDTNGIGETDLIMNLHVCHSQIVPPIVVTDFNAAPGYVLGASGSFVFRASWRRQVFRDFTDWDIVILAANDSATNDATVRFRLASDHTKYADVTVPKSTSKWNTRTGRLTFDPTAGRDTVEMLIKDGAGGHVMVRSVTIWPSHLPFVAAGVTTEGFVPLDTVETDADSGLSVHVRQTEINNCEVLRKTRTDTFVGWCEDTQVRGGEETFVESNADYVVQVPQLWLAIPKGVTKLRWAVLGYREGASGKVRLRTNTMKKLGIAAVEVTLGATWADPYDVWVDSDGSTELAVTPDADDALEVALKGDGTDNAHLQGLSVWAKEAA